MLNQQIHKSKCPMFFDITKPLDIKPPVKAIDGDTKKYFKMIACFEQMTLTPIMKDIAAHTNQHDWAELIQRIITLQSKTGLIGAGKVHYACYYMSEALVTRDFGEVAKCYQLLVESVIELKRYLRRFLCEYARKYYIETSSAYSTSIGKGFTLVLHKASNTYFCLASNQSLEERIDELRDHMYKPDIVQ